MEATIRKVPFIVDAVLYDGELVGAPSADDPAKVQPLTCPEWFPALTEETRGPVTTVRPGRVVSDGELLYVGTIKGTHRVWPGDWITRGIDGELYPFKAADFAAKWEKVEVTVAGEDGEPETATAWRRRPSEDAAG